MGRFTIPDAAPRADKANGATVPTTLLDALSTRVHVDVTIPRTDVRGKMRLCSRTEEFAAHAEARQTMSAAGYPINAEVQAGTAAEQWSVEIAVRMLQRAVRDPRDVKLELASIEDWRELDDMQILALWAEYQDLAQQLDPVGATSLTAAQVALIDAAAKKKDVDLLMAFGSPALASYAITSASRPAPSETPTSTPGQSPS